MPAILAVGFPIFWCAIVYWISLVGGWRQLARRYRTSSPISGTTWRFRSAAMHNWSESSYNSCLKLTANEEGLGLSVFFPFRFGHPPLFIPWSDMLVSQVRRVIFFNRVRFTFPDQPAIWIDITPRLAAKIQKAIACDWFADAR
jgi:hypothetical protein